MDDNQNILNCVLYYAETTPLAKAILIPGQPEITYSQLSISIHIIVGLLLRLGFGNKSRIAVIAHDGPEMATLFLAVSGIMTCAPLNPKYTYEEYKFHLSDLGIDAIIVDNEIVVAIEAANDLGVKVIPLSQISEMIAYNNESTDVGVNLTHHLSQKFDTAMILHTSGTTARPKIVPLTHQNICSSAQNIVASMKLTGSDRCLNTVPLFHVKGIIGALVTSILSGGGFVCSRSFAPEKFYESLENFSPTWYTAVPTIHQAILAQGRFASFGSQRTSLRFIRSCSASLSQQIALELEQLFQVPVLESYGMTETASQMAVNPLPPEQRKTGSVGKAVGCEIAVLDHNGKIVSDESVGEIIVRGASVIEGYENNPIANQSSFFNEWLRTGDLGYMDSDGYLFIKGRIKELINRGGEKVMPLEVEEVILKHPSVMQAVTFAIPHPTLGEDVAIAIVKRSETEVSEVEVRQFIAASLAGFKVPTKVIFINEIPKGQTGKIQRVNMAEKLNLISEKKSFANYDDISQPTIVNDSRQNSMVPFKQKMRSIFLDPLLQLIAPSFLLASQTPVMRGGQMGHKSYPELNVSYNPKPMIYPRNKTEEKLEEIWSNLLNIGPISVVDNFFELGGNSLLTMQLFSEIEKAFIQKLPVSVIFQEDTIEKLAKLLDSYDSEKDFSSYLVTIQPYGNKPPLFCIHNLSGEVISYRNLVHELANDQPVYGLRYATNDNAANITIQEMAATYLQEIKKIQPEGPYFLVGHSLGGMIAYEMAQELINQLQEVSLLALFDTRNPKCLRSISNSKKIIVNTNVLFKISWRQKLPFIKEKFKNNLGKKELFPYSPSDEIEEREKNLLIAANSFDPKPYPGRIVFFRANDNMNNLILDEKYGWECTGRGSIDIYNVPGNHTTMLDKINVTYVMKHLKNYL
ncbi:Acyl-CoA synthetase (AMP-forming)/AMP-acid ligase II [Paenibacillus sp. yr247]|uniref:non-ribosomal peptide synthetase n=1 Tax=Paenibacillus sp. yr247 TaxID=1761880 RepID=UPI00088C42AE|nr:AMP-binding protein [Paenibacillus sp. yr247]SDN32228.1 Acyl-CoA synthetase (AMP-forming)/AMP-acid ligase II [Paenibacillus sp. yr247]